MFSEMYEVCGYTWQTEYGSELTREYVEDSELHFLAAFLAIQHLMLHCKELLSYRVEECIMENPHGPAAGSQGQTDTESPGNQRGSH